MSHNGDSRALIRHNAAAHDQVATIYDRKHSEIFNPLEQQRIGNAVARILSLLQKPVPEVLDLGAGTGNLTLKFLAAGCRVCAADVSARSLDELARKAPPGARLITRVLADKDLPFASGSFDVVGAYSVLHHIPDYLFALREMMRVLRPGGLLYVDHESSDRAWQAAPALEEYRALTRYPVGEHLLNLMRTGEMFTLAFAKTVFMKALVNRRYEREGDIHVWPDDHIEWDKVRTLFAENATTVVHVEEYLHYRPRGGLPLYERYRTQCSDMLCVIARKQASPVPSSESSGSAS